MVMDSETGSWNRAVGACNLRAAAFDLADTTLLGSLIGCKSALRLRLLLDLVSGC